MAMGEIKLSAAAKTATRHKFEFVTDDGRVWINEVDVIIAAASEWSARPESSNPRWSACPLPGGLVRAVRSVAAC